MRVLFVGDVVSAPGCALLRKKLPGFKKLKAADFCVVNGENSAPGNGITPASLSELLGAGADLVTGGNHSLRRKEIWETLDSPYCGLIRPMNLHRSAPGVGVTVLERGGLRLGVANIIGSVYMDWAENPFDALDAAVDRFRTERVLCTLVDFHAEATSEKKAMGYYAEGRVSALLGTHTHVQTADAEVLPGGTAYITDVGMTGVKRSVLGVKIENATMKMRTGLPVRFDQADGPASMSCVLVEMDTATGRAREIESFCIE